MGANSSPIHQGSSPIISDLITQELLDRQVLWTLDRDSGNHGELCFLETQEVSQYRLQVTFSAGLTGLRLPATYLLTPFRSQTLNVPILFLK